MDNLNYIQIWEIIVLPKEIATTKICAVNEQWLFTYQLAEANSSTVTPTYNCTSSHPMSFKTHYHGYRLFPSMTSLSMQHSMLALHTLWSASEQMISLPSHHTLAAASPWPECSCDKHIAYEFRVTNQLFNHIPPSLLPGSTFIVQGVHHKMYPGNTLQALWRDLSLARSTRYSQ